MDVVFTTESDIVAKKTHMFNVQTFRIVFLKFRIIFFLVTLPVMKKKGSDLSEKKLFRLSVGMLTLSVGMLTLSVDMVTLSAVYVHIICGVYSYYLR